MGFYDFNVKEADEDEFIKEIVDNNRQISELLSKNESLYKQHCAAIGADYDSYELEHGENKIQLPSGLTKKGHEIEVEFYLDRIFTREGVDEENDDYIDTLRRNSYYTIIQNDKYMYLLRRINYYGVVKNLFYKDMLVGIASVFESVLKQSLQKMHDTCAGCPKLADCQRAVEKTRIVLGSRGRYVLDTRNRIIADISFVDAINVFKTYDLINFATLAQVQSDCNIVDNLRGIRNNVHLAKLDKRQLEDDIYTREMYMEARETLKRMNKYIANEINYRVRHCPQ